MNDTNTYQEDQQTSLLRFESAAGAYAQTIGLRHGLDADHISAIDNVTRHLVSLGQLPITCGQSRIP